MPTLSAGDLLRVRVVCSAGDQISVNTAVLEVSSLTGNVTDQEVADAVDGEWSGPLKDVLSDDATYRGLSVQRFFPGTLLRPAISVNGAGSGTVTGDIMPKQVCGILAFTCENAGAKFRGRWYLPFPSEASNEAPGKPTAAYLASVEALGDQVIDPDAITLAGGTIGLRLLLYHRSVNAGTIITGRIARPMWGTQMRRGDYGKKNVVPF